MHIFIAPDSGGLVQQLGRFTCSAANRYIALGINGSRIEVLQFIFDRQVNISSWKNDAAIIGKVIGIDNSTITADHHSLYLGDVFNGIYIKFCCCRNSSCIFKVIRGSYSNAAFLGNEFSCLQCIAASRNSTAAIGKNDISILAEGRSGSEIGITVSNCDLPMLTQGAFSIKSKVTFAADRAILAAITLHRQQSPPLLYRYVSILVKIAADVYI